jgi:acetyl-CoA acyltransferase
VHYFSSSDEAHHSIFTLYSIKDQKKMKRTAIVYRRAVIVTGVRTPFVKSFGEFTKVDTVGLSVASVAGLLNKTKLNPESIDHMIWGNVVMQTNAPNCAREIVIDLNMPKHIAAHSTSMACASGLNAITQAVTLIESGHADVVIAGGSDSVSNGELPIPRRLAYGLAQFIYGKQKGIYALPNFFKEAGYNPLKWLPTPPSIAERSTGKTMGWHGDMIAELYGVTRQEQEALAIKSHQNAASALEKGYFKDEVVPVQVTKGKKTVDFINDNLIQKDVKKMQDKMPTMRTAFRKEGGSITAATSSALTDGASAVLVMSEEKAKQMGYPTDVSLKSWHFSAIDPFPQLLLAPVLGWPHVLRKAGLKPEDIDLFEIHEAFAAQVLVTIKCLQSADFAKKYLNSDKPVFEQPLDMSKLNVNGGSIAIGHPFAATGGRIVGSLTNELRRSGKRHGLVSICAAGGLGGVAILEHTPKK